MRPAPCLALCVLAIGLVGCSTHVARPDAQLARIVDRESRNPYETAATAGAHLEPVELASAGVALEALELLYVPGRHEAHPAPAVARAPVPSGWHQAPAAWIVYTTPAAEDSAWDPTLQFQKSGRTDRGEGMLSLEDDPDHPGGSKRPRVRINLLNLKINDHPVSFSGSLKGTGNLLVRATIRF